jgi:hypothetical protein
MLQKVFVSYGLEGRCVEKKMLGTCGPVSGPPEVVSPSGCPDHEAVVVADPICYRRELSVSCEKPEASTNP